MLSIQETQQRALLKSNYIKKEPMARIMIVDDDVELLEELKEVLSFNNYQVEVMPNSALAFEVAEKLTPDLIILDLKMKPKSGFQLADEIRNSFKTKNIPIIAITGFFTEKEHILMMKLCGIKTFILKPFSPVNLITKVEFALGRRREEYDDQGT